MHMHRDIGTQMVEANSEVEYFQWRDGQRLEHRELR